MPTQKIFLTKTTLMHSLQLGNWHCSCLLWYELTINMIRGNVAFGSAGDGWAFRIDMFSKLYASKLGASATSLQRAFWGDWFFSPKQKKILGKKAAGGKLRPMFSQFILEPIWKIYETALNCDTAGLEKITKSIAIQLPARELKHADPRAVVQSVLARYQ